MPLLSIGHNVTAKLSDAGHITSVRCQLPPSPARLPPMHILRTAALVWAGAFVLVDGFRCRIPHDVGQAYLYLPYLRLPAGLRELLSPFLACRVVVAA